MNMSLVRIVEACKQNCHFFTRHRNVAGFFGFSAYQKMSAAMRVIAYGVPADYAYEYIHIGEDTTMKCICIFPKTMIRVFGPEYLRAPNEDEVKKLTRQQNLQLRINHHVKTKVSSTSTSCLLFLNIAVSASDHLPCIFYFSIGREYPSEKAE